MAIDLGILVGRLITIKGTFGSTPRKRIVPAIIVEYPAKDAKGADYKKYAIRYLGSTGQEVEFTVEPNELVHVTNNIYLLATVPEKVVESASKAKAKGLTHTPSLSGLIKANLMPKDNYDNRQ